MIKKIKTYVTDSPFVARSKSRLETTSLPGFQGVSLYSVGIFLYNEIFLNPMLMMRANAIAFSFFMSLFPAFLVIFSLIPFWKYVQPRSAADMGGDRPTPTA